MHATRPLEEATVRYVIDAKASRFVVQAFSTGLLSAFGHSPKISIRDFDGDLSFTQANGSLQNSRLRVRVQADSLEVMDDISDKDRREIQSRMQDEVLEVDSYPEITYECSRVSASGNGDTYWVVLSGDLTLHGVTKLQAISARVNMNSTSLRASGEFTVRQSAYEIPPVTAVGGTIRLKDELKFSFEIVANLQK